MSKGTRRKKRPYTSPLREEQAAATRKRILDAVIDEMREGRQDFSIPRLAEAAGCSVPTVYRHFPTRQDLLTAVYEHLHTLVPPPPVEEDPERTAEVVRATFEHLQRVHDELGMDLDTPHIWEMRRSVTVPERRAYVDRMLDAWAPGLEEPERTWLSDLIVILVSSASARAFRNYLGLDADATADRVNWALDALRAHAVNHLRERRMPDAPEH